MLVRVKGEDVNASALLARVQQQAVVANAGAARLGATFAGPLTSGQQRAANSALALAQAQARLAVAQGNNQSAIAGLNTALAANVGASQRATLGVQTQIARLQSGRTAFAQFGDAAKSSLTGIIGPAALAGAALAGVTQVIQSFVEAFTFKAQLDASRTAITAQLVGVRDSAEAFSQAADFANKYKLTQEETTKVLQSSVGVLRQSKSSIEDVIGTLLRLQQLSPEQGLEGAALALKELQSGSTTSLVGRFEVGITAAAKMREEIKGGADAVQVLGQFLDQSGISMGNLEARTRGTQGALNDLKIAQEGLTLAQAEFAQGPGLAILQAQTVATSGATRVLSGDMQAMGQSFLQATADGNGWLAILSTIPGMQALNSQAARDAAAATLTLQAATATQTDATLAAGAATQFSTQQTALHALTMDAERQAAFLSTQAITDHALATEEDALKAVIASVQAETLTIRKGELAQQAQIAAQALIASGQAGEATAARLAASSSLVDVATAAYLRLAAAQAAAGAAQAQSNFRAGERTGGAARTTAEEGRLAAAHANSARHAREAAEASARYQAQLGNLAPSLARAQAELAKLAPGSAAAFDKMTEIARIKEQQAQAARRGAAKTGGAARLSDQQKLNNTLLSDQDKFNDQAERAAIEHEQRLLDIEREFQEKSLAQQRGNEVSKRQSRADFYDSLTSATADVGPQIAAELSAAYEQAYAEAQAMAQAGNHKLAADYLALKEQQIKDELEFQKKLAAAREAGDKAEVRRLEAIHKLRQDAQAEEQKQLLAGGDANVTDRADALDEEGRRFEEQQGKIGTAAEQAAQRKVDAAVRSGKAVDAENVKLREQEAILGRIGGRPAGTAGATPIPTGAGTEATAPAIDLGGAFEGLRQAVAAVEAAINAQGGNVTKAQGETTNAVRGLQGKFLQ